MKPSAFKYAVIFLFITFACFSACNNKSDCCDKNTKTMRDTMVTAAVRQTADSVYYKKVKFTIDRKLVYRAADSLENFINRIRAGFDETNFQIRVTKLPASGFCIFTDLPLANPTDSSFLDAVNTLSLPIERKVLLQQIYEFYKINVGFEDVFVEMREGKLLSNVSLNDFDMVQYSEIDRPADIDEDESYFRIKGRLWYVRNTEVYE